MLTIEHTARLAERYQMPLEDVLFIALNVHGAKLDCEFGRIRMDFRLAENDQFRCAKERGEFDYFFALPVNPESEFILFGDVLSFGEMAIGQAINPMEDVSDLYYFRRKKTVLNFNPNARSACAGCRFCYTSRLTPNDEQRIETTDELKVFFENWMHKYGFADLSHLVQISVVTGNYRESDSLCRFLLELKAGGTGVSLRRQDLLPRVADYDAGAAHATHGSATVRYLLFARSLRPSEPAPERQEVART